MNRRAVFTIILILLFNLFFISLTVFGLTMSQQNIPPGVAILAAKPLKDAESAAVSPLLLNGRAPSDFGGGEWQEALDEITTEQRQQIEAAIAQNQAMLAAQNRLPALDTETAVALSWPIQPAEHLDDFGYHGIANFVDQNSSYPYALLDYACGQRTYDTYGGYNHPGTDIFTWPFPWNRMDNSEVSIVSAADGIIIHKQDGNYDRNCSFTGLPWNAVYVQHADGSVAWYGHMKNGSVTTKSVGSAVTRGEYLGIVGSSGSSTAPHLHFELHNIYNQTIDPYAGSCNATIGDSLWLEQPAYYDSAVNLITTGYAAPYNSSCSTPEQSRAADEFNPGDEIYFTTYYRDQLGSLPSTYTIYRPDGTIYEEWEHSIPHNHYAASWWYWSYEFELDDPQGFWQFAVEFNSQVYTHTFLIGTPPPPPAPEPTPLITVTAPNGGELFAPGSTQTVTWSTVLTEGVKVDLYWREMFSKTLALDVAGEGHGRVTWTIPVSTSTSAGYSIRVSSVVSNTIFDESDHHFIVGILDKHVFMPVAANP